MKTAVASILTNDWEGVKLGDLRVSQKFYTKRRQLKAEKDQLI
jgi:hypothetical protein